MNWEEALDKQKKLKYFKQIIQLVDDERRQGHVIYPPQDEVFQAIELTPLKDVKVVILGQDPYHAPNQAHGLAFCRTTT